MANLPVERVTPNKPPFSSVGVDCFGPFEVRRGRSLAKRYGVLYTCVAIRAIHIEVIHSMDTDSFINSMRRFIARRGNPEVIRSDNLNNCVCGNKELCAAISQWNNQKIPNSQKIPDATPSHLLLLRSGQSSSRNIHKRRQVLAKKVETGTVPIRCFLASVGSRILTAVTRETEVDQ